MRPQPETANIFARHVETDPNAIVSLNEEGHAH